MEEEEEEEEREVVVLVVEILGVVVCGVGGCRVR